MSNSSRIFSYFSYWLDAVDEHSLHSPFFFDFYQNIVKNNAGIQPVEAFEKLREKLLNDNRPLRTTDLGAGAGRPARTIAEIARGSLSTPESSILYSNIINHIKAKTILEIGTSFGINTLYLAQKKDCKVFTFEGSSEIAAIARLTFEFAAASNIQLIEGNIDETLSDFLPNVRKIDFVLVDANHRYKPTIDYFEELLPRIKDSGVMVFDDIYYSSEMKKAWKEIQQHELVHASADLFQCGVVLFDPSLNKQHVILQY